MIPALVAVLTICLALVIIVWLALITVFTLAYHDAWKRVKR